MPITQPADKNLPRRTLLTSLILALAMLGIYTYLDLAGYLNLPWLRTLPQPWNDNVVYLIIMLAAVSASSLGFLLTHQFKAREPQRLIWLFFACGWTCWTTGEVSSFIYHQIYPVLPDLTISDIFWVAGYIFFGLSLFYQYLLIYIHWNIHVPLRRTRLPYFFLMALLVLLIALVITLLVRQTGLEKDSPWLNTYLLVFYPLCDLVEGLAALWFALLFRRGLLGRPWFGLLAFAISDGISSWYWMGGYKILSSQADTWLSLFTDLLYLGGYLIAAFGCLSIFLMLKYGVARQDFNASPGPRTK